LTGPQVDSVNTFEKPDTVVTKAITVTLTGGRLSLTLPPRSVTVISVEH